MGWVNNASGGVSPVGTMQDADGTIPSPSRSIPVCVVVMTQPSYKVYPNLKVGENKVSPAYIELPKWRRVFHSKTDWAVLSARVQLTRFYAASTAKVVIAPDIRNLGDAVPPPGLIFGHPKAELNAAGYDIETFKTHEIRPEMEIEVWLGYTNQFEGGDFMLGGNLTDSGVPDPRKLTKVFTGVVDSCSLKMGRGENQMDGVSCTITARDKLRYLVDNKYFGQLTIPGANFTSTKGVPRTTIVEHLVKQGSAGFVSPACENDPGSPLWHPSGRPPMVINPLRKIQLEDKSSIPFITNANVPFAIADQFPVDVIRWFSGIETMPRELYCDQETGKIAWTARMLGEPYKKTGDAVLFGNVKQYTTVAADATTLENMILDAGGSNVSPADAAAYSLYIEDAFRTAFGGTDQGFISVATYCGLITHESRWKKDAKNPTSSATGLLQFLKNTYPPEAALIPQKAILQGLTRFVEQYEATISGTSTSLAKLHAAGKISDEDLEKTILISHYYGFPGTRAAIGALLDEKKALTYPNVQAALKKRTPKDYPGRVPEVTKNIENYAESILKLRDQHFALVDLARVQSKTPAGEEPKKKGGGSTNIGVYRGKAHPWTYSYRKPVTVKRGGKTVTIQPNVLSAHADWTTLGIITRFTLLNPVVEKGNGSKGAGQIRGSHGLFGTPVVSPNFPIENATRARFSGEGGEGVSDPNKAQLTRDPNKSSTDPATKQPKIYMGEASLPIKFLSKIRLPIRNRYLWDETADSRMTDNVVDHVLNAMLNIHGMDIHAADILVPMNPDMRPGHVVEVHNLGYFDNEQMRAEEVIHMFASGGVQNGCTTMAGLVSTQGAYDPLEIPGFLEDIMRIQKASLDAVSSVQRASGDTITKDGASDMVRPIHWRVDDYVFIKGLERDLKRIRSWAQYYTDRATFLAGTNARLRTDTFSLEAQRERVRKDYIEINRAVTQYFSEVKALTATYLFQKYAEDPSSDTIVPSGVTAFGKGYRINSTAVRDRLHTLVTSTFYQLSGLVGTFIEKFQPGTLTDPNFTLDSVEQKISDLQRIDSGDTFLRRLRAGTDGITSDLGTGGNEDATFGEDLARNRLTLLERKAMGMQPRAWKFIPLIATTTNGPPVVIAPAGPGHVTVISTPLEDVVKTADQYMRELQDQGLRELEDACEKEGYQGNGTEGKMLLYDWVRKQRIWVYTEKTSSRYTSGKDPAFQAGIDAILQRIDSYMDTLRREIESAQGKTSSTGGTSQVSAVPQVPNAPRAPGLGDISLS